MRQPTLFDVAEPEAEATPIARVSDPATSHKAAAKTESGRTELQGKCLLVWSNEDRDMTVKEVALLVMARCFPEIKKTDERYTTQLENCRKRANEVANKHCQDLELRRDGCRLFRVRKGIQ